MRTIQDFPMQMVHHINADTHGELYHRNAELGVNRLVYTPKKKGVWGTGEVYWKLDGSENEHEDITGLVEEMKTAKCNPKMFAARQEFVAAHNAARDITP